MRCGITCGLVCFCVRVCLSVCPVCALTFESLDLETSFFRTQVGASSEYLGNIRMSRSSDEGQGRNKVIGT